MLRSPDRPPCLRGFCSWPLAPHPVLTPLVRAHDLIHFRGGCRAEAQSAGIRCESFQGTPLQMFEQWLGQLLRYFAWALVTPKRPTKPPKVRSWLHRRMRGVAGPAIWVGLNDRSRGREPIRGKQPAAPARARNKYSGNFNVPCARGFQRETNENRRPGGHHCGRGALPSGSRNHRPCTDDVT